MTTALDNFRSCMVTGLRVDKNADKLITVHAVTAVLWLAAGGVLALLLALSRWEAVGLITDSEWFYRIISAHGAMMLVFWILFFEMAGLIFGGSILLNTRLRMPKLGWVVYVMMLLGSLGVAWTMLSGRATVMFTAYPPLEASPWFYGSLLIFAVGALLGVLHFLGNVVAARIAGEVFTLPMFTFGLVAAAILALFTLASGSAALIPTFFWSVGLLDSVDPGMYRLLFWGFGHGAQQVNLAAMVAIWYALASLTVGAKPINEGLSRLAFVLYILFIQMGSIHHILVDPGLGHWARGINASYFLYAAVIGSMIHAFTIPASIEAAQRENGIGKGLLGWLRSGPWSSPAFSGLILSFALFGILGGISGVIMGGIQVNIIAHNTLIVPAHFHMTVVAGTTLAFMAMSYILVPLIVKRDLFLPAVARWQPWVYAVGMTIFGFGMGFAGHYGLPRRHFDIGFGGSPMANDIFADPMIGFTLAALGIGALIAITGGAMFIVVAAGTVFLGKRSDTPNIGPVSAAAFAPSEAEPIHVPVAGEAFQSPGTLFLAGFWLAVFVALYAWSWLELGDVGWMVG
jgi:cytochrome c oxidase subunit 1